MEGMDKKAKIMIDMYGKLCNPPVPPFDVATECWRKYTEAASRCLSTSILVFNFALIAALLNTYFVLRIDRHAYVATELLDLCVHELKNLGEERWKMVFDPDVLLFLLFLIIQAIRIPGTRAAELVSHLPASFEKCQEWYGRESHDLLKSILESNTVTPISKTFLLSLHYP